jgi:hypothetical protein
LDAVTAATITNLIIGLAVLAFILCRQLQPRPVRDNMRLPLILGVIGRKAGQSGLGSASLLLYFGVTFTIQRIILQARAQRIGPQDPAGPRNTGAPSPSAPSW